MRVRVMAMAMALLYGGCAAEPDASAVVVDRAVRAPTVATVPALAWHVVLDPSVGVPEEVVIRRALLDWEHVIPCAVDFIIERRAVSAVDALLPPAGVVEIQMGVPPAGVGWADWDPMGRLGARIVLLPNATDADRADFPRVVEHELGHAFHLEHTTSGLMAHPPKLGARVGPNDGATFAAKWCPAT